MTKTIGRLVAGVACTLGVGAFIGWLGYRYIDQKPAEVHMKLSDKFFSPDYFTARHRFREMVASAGGRLETIPLDAKGPNGEALGIDIAW